MYNVHANDADMKFFMKFLSDVNSFQENTKMLISLEEEVDKFIELSRPSLQ